jgi:hypothetical protein
MTRDDTEHGVEYVLKEDYDNLRAELERLRDVTSAADAESIDNILRPERERSAMSRELPPCDHDECPPTHCNRSGSFAAPAGYAAGIEYSKSYAAWMPNNCAVIERTADGVSVGPCTHYLENGTTCPRHGKVKPHNDQAEPLPPDGERGRH